MEPATLGRGGHVGGALASAPLMLQWSPAGLQRGGAYRLAYLSPRFTPHWAPPVSSGVTVHERLEGDAGQAAAMEPAGCRG
jgi:hypothetical protein